MTMGRFSLVVVWLGVSLLSACGSEAGKTGTDPGFIGATSGVGTPPLAGTTAVGIAGAAGSAGRLAGTGGTLGASGSGVAVAGTGPAASGGASGASGAAGSVAGGGAGAPAAGGSGGTGAGETAAAGGSGAAPGNPGECTSLPAVTDYAAMGPFADAKMFASVGPSRNYTMYRPDSSLGKDGFKHPVTTWGNGILTTPDMYKKLLTLVASHGFVVIGCNDTQPERPCLNAGMEWLIAQNEAEGPLKGKLDVSREVAIGYSWGGGAAIDTANRPNIKAVFSLHGMPPRETDAFGKMHTPLLMTTSTGDNFVTASGYVTPQYEKTKTQTFYATLEDATNGHLSIADEGASICTLAAPLVSTFGTCKGAVDEQALAVAWLRLWACDDQAAKKFFFGDDCVLCQKPWIKPQRKNWQ